MRKTMYLVEDTENEQFHFWDHELGWTRSETGEIKQVWHHIKYDLKASVENHLIKTSLGKEVVYLEPMAIDREEITHVLVFELAG